MNKYSIIFLPVLFFFLPGCENRKKANNEMGHDPITSGGTSTQMDSAVAKFTEDKSGPVVANRDTQPYLHHRLLKADDHIIQCPADQKDELRRHIEWLREEWQNVPNPLTAIYQGNDFGDYQHILFKAENGVEYDFGQANNSYGPYKLYEPSGQYEDNPEFLGKKFKVYWDWVVSDFFCCEGEYGKARAYLPAVTKLELMKN